MNCPNCGKERPDNRAARGGFAAYCKPCRVESRAKKAHSRRGSEEVQERTESLGLTMDSTCFDSDHPSLPEATLIHRVILQAMEDAITPYSAVSNRNRADAYEWLHDQAFDDWMDLLYPEDEEAEHYRERILKYVDEWRERVESGEPMPRFATQKGPPRKNQ